MVLRHLQMTLRSDLKTAGLIGRGVGSSCQNPLPLVKLQRTWMLKKKRQMRRVHFLNEPEAFTLALKRPDPNLKFNVHVEIRLSVI